MNETSGRILRVVHDTRYTYQQDVRHSTHIFHLLPVQDSTQALLKHDLTISVEGERLPFEDVFGNRALRFEVTQPYRELRIHAESLVSTIAGPGIDPGARRFSSPLYWLPWQQQMLQPYLLPPELPVPQLRALSEFAHGFLERNNNDMIAALQEMNAAVHRDFSYSAGTTTLETTPFEVYVSRRGVCQDFTNLFICMARLLNVPARYRVGYIHTGADYENTIQSEASHAWVEIYLPVIGWCGFDPTNGRPVGPEHVRVAAGRNYRDATPTSGTILEGGGGETLTVNVRVVDETAKPPDG